MSVKCRRVPQLGWATLVAASLCESGDLRRTVLRVKPDEPVAYSLAAIVAAVCLVERTIQTADCGAPLDTKLTAVGSATDAILDRRM